MSLASHVRRFIPPSDCVKALVFDGINQYVIDNQQWLAFNLGIAVGALPMARGHGKHLTVINRQPHECLCHVDFRRLATKFKCDPVWDGDIVMLEPILGRN
jgi:hypothetical protein